MGLDNVQQKVYSPNAMRGSWGLRYLLLKIQYWKMQANNPNGLSTSLDTTLALLYHYNHTMMGFYYVVLSNALQRLCNRRMWSL